MCVYDEHQELVRIHNDSASKSSKYTTDDKVGKVNYVKVTGKTNPGFQ